MAEAHRRGRDADAGGADAPRVVLITAPLGERTRELARGLVEARLAACVNLVDGVRSVYRWEGAVAEDAEVLMVVKTTAGRVPELEGWLGREHPYDVPECVSIHPASVEEKYLTWLRAEVEPAR